MASCSIVGCNAQATCKVLDWRRRRGTGAPAVQLACDWHGQRIGRQKGVSVKGIVERRGGPGPGQSIDLKAALKRLGKL